MPRFMPLAYEARLDRQQFHCRSGNRGGRATHHRPRVFLRVWPVIKGYFAYHALPTNLRACSFRFCVTKLWLRPLRRRSQRRCQKTPLTWGRISRLVYDWLPAPKDPSSMAGAQLCRQTGKVGAVCGSSASTDLCVGRPVMGVSTAITLRGKWVGRAMRLTRIPSRVMCRR